MDSEKPTNTEEERGGGGIDKIERASEGGH